MSSSEKVMRRFVKSIADYADEMDEPGLGSAYRPIWDLSLEASEILIRQKKTDLERLMEWLHSRWGDYDAAGPDSGPLTSDQIRRFVIDEVLQYIADEFNVKGKEETRSEI